MCHPSFLPTVIPADSTSPRHPMALRLGYKVSTGGLPDLAIRKGKAVGETKPTESKRAIILYSTVHFALIFRCAIPLLVKFSLFPSIFPQIHSPYLQMSKIFRTFAPRLAQKQKTQDMKKLSIILLTLLCAVGTTYAAWMPTPRYTKSSATASCTSSATARPIQLQVKR